MADLHDLSAAYALDSLDAAERVDFEYHLESCARCRGEVARLAEGVTHLVDTSAHRPPAHLKAQIMEKVALPGAAASRPDVFRLRSRRWGWAFAAAATLAVVFAGLLVILDARLDQAEKIAAVYEAGDAVSIMLDSDVGPAEFTYSAELGLGVLVDRGLVEPEGDRVYELWLVDDSGPSPAGIFRPGGDRVIVSDVAPGLVLAMTEEPAGGSDLPTGGILFATDL